MDRGFGPNTDSLLEHAGFVRALARGLLRDVHKAEDIVQETMLAAARRPPREIGRLRAWMGSVARNLSLRALRGDARRSKRERAAARSERLPDTAEVVTQLELQRRVVEEVQGLAEPYRSTVVHRFLHSRTVQEIAALEGVPTKTVESRLRRALRTLRARLDRPGVAGALAVLAWPRRSRAATMAHGGAIAVSTKSKLAVVAAILVLALGGVASLPLLERGEEQDARASATRGLSLSETVSRQPSVQAPTESGKLEQSSAARPPGRWRGGVVTGRVGWEGQAVPDGTTLRLLPVRGGGRPRALEAKARPDGTFRFERVPAGGYLFTVRAPGYAPWTDGYTYTIGPEHPAVELSGRLVKGSTLRLRVRDSGGRMRRGFLVHFFGPMPLAVDISLSSDEHGLIEMPHCPSGTMNLRFELPEGVTHEWKIHIVGEGYSNYREVVERTIVLDAELVGTVRDAQGKALAGSTVEARGATGFRAEVRTDEDGRFRLCALEPGDYSLVATATGMGIFGGTAHVTDSPLTRHDIACQPGAILGRIEREPEITADATVILNGPEFVRIPVERETQFAIWSVPSGAYKLSVHTRQAGVSIPLLRLELGEREVRRDLAFSIGELRDGEVELEIRGKDGELVERAQFYVELAQGSVSQAPRAHAPGRFRLRMAPGSWCVKIRCGDAGSADIRVRVDPDRTTHESVQLK